ncbi:enoyl-CoA hydratase/isomerase family protein [Gordonia aichiensis]
MTSTTTSPADAAVTQDGDVLVLRLADPGKGSALDDPALRAATAALREVARGEREVGAILLLGAGRNFCAGGNVRDFASAQHRPTFIRALADTFHDFVTALLDADRPVVAGVRGWAAGAGLSIVLHADVAIGGPSTNLRPAYTGIGLSPDGGMTWTLPRIVGAARAREIILTDRVISADEAYSWGILSRLVDDAEIDDTAADIARTLAAGPRAGLAAARALLTGSATAGLRDQLAAEAHAISTNSGTPEGIEGVDAFVDKRTPDYAAARNR